MSMPEKQTDRLFRQEPLTYGGESVLAIIAGRGLEYPDCGLDVFLDESGFWREEKRLGYSSLLDSSYEEINDQVYAVLGQIFPINQRMIDPDSKKFGYWNEHQWPHALKTARLTKDILEAFGVCERQIKNGYLAGLIHDIGCFLGRKDHGRVSALMLPLIFDGVVWDDLENWEALNEALAHHNKENLTETKELDDCCNLTKALRIADKIDAGEQRVNPRAGDNWPRSLEEDKHTIANFYFKLPSFRVEGNQVFLELGFSFYPEDDQVERIKDLLEEDENKRLKKRSSPLIEKIAQEKGVSYFQAAIDYCMETYPEIFFTVRKGIFSLFDENKINEAILVFRNLDKGELREYGYNRRCCQPN